MVHVKKLFRAEMATKENRQTGRYGDEKKNKKTTKIDKH